MNDDNRQIKNIDVVIDKCICIFIGFIIGIGVSLIIDEHHKVPAENNAIIDSLIAVNDTIKIKVEKLDSIKDAKVIEVSTLDNDSTLKLFHELVSE
jgi:predicted transcriptional regulator